MRKSYFSGLAALVVLSYSCNMAELEPQHLPSNKVTVTATVENEGVTKSTVGENSEFLWADGDKISIYTSLNTFKTFTLTDGAGKATATFEANLDTDETETGIAVYPASEEHSYADGSVTVNYPETYGATDKDYASNTNAVMVSDSDADIVFKHVGGVFKVTISNLPKSATGLELKTDKVITGDFSLAEGKAEASEGETGKSVRINFAVASTSRGEQDFYFPVPVGEYTSLELGYYVGEDYNEIVKTDGVSNTVGRADLVIMPKLEIKDEQVSAEVEQALREALASEDKGTFTLTSDIQIAEVLHVSKAFTLNLGGKSITPASGFAAKNLIQVNDGGKLSITGEGSIDTGNTPSIYGGIMLCQNAELIITGNPVIKGYYYAIDGNGNLHDTVVEIHDGTYGHYTAETGKNAGLAIYHPQEGKLTIHGGKFTGYGSAVEMRAGELLVKGGEFTSTCETFSAEPNGSGSTINGAAIAVSQHATERPISITIEGGKFVGTHAVHEEDLQAEPSENITLKITGGTFDGEIFSDNCRGFISKGSFNHPTALDYLAADAEVSVTLEDNYTGPGFGLYTGGNGDGADVTLDLGGHTWTVGNPLHGSTGTVTQSFHFEKGAEVSVSNGTITVPENASAKMLIQNYSDLNLDNVILNGENLNKATSEGGTAKRYVLSNNCGTTVLKGTTINAGDNFAFDVCYNAAYPDGVHVTLESGEINGDVEVSALSSPSADKCTLTVNGGTIKVGAYDSENRKAAIRAEGEALVTVSGGSIVAVAEEDIVDNGNYAVTLRKGADFKMSGGEIKAGWFALATNGLDSETSTVNITGGTLTSEIDYALFLNTDDDNHESLVTVISGETSISGKAGAIAAKAGSLTIEGGTFTNLGNGNVGTGTDGTTTIAGRAALYVEGGKAVVNGGTFNGGQGGSYSALQVRKTADVTVNGGDFSVGADENNEGNSCAYVMNSAKLFIKGGSFETQAAYNGKYWVLNKFNDSQSTSTLEVSGGTFENFNPAKPNTDDDESYLAANCLVECTSETADCAEAWNSSLGNVTYTVKAE